MSGETFRFHHDVEVRFRDLDPMGHAHHSLALIYFEEARTAYWREVAGGVAESIDFVLGEVLVRYHARTLFPGRLRVGVRTAHVSGRSFTMEYEARRADGTLVSSGRTVQVMFDYALGGSKPVPGELRSRLLEFEAGAPGGMAVPDSVPAPPAGESGP